MKKKIICLFWEDLSNDMSQNPPFHLKFKIWPSPSPGFSYDPQPQFFKSNDDSFNEYVFNSFLNKNILQHSQERAMEEKKDTLRIQFRIMNIWLTNVIPERIIFVSWGITVYIYQNFGRNASAFYFYHFTKTH